MRKYQDMKKSYTNSRGNKIEVTVKWRKGKYGDEYIMTTKKNGKVVDKDLLTEDYQVDKEFQEQVEYADTY